MGELHVGLVAALLVVAGPASADPSPDVVVHVQDPAILESSGLVARAGEFVTVNDSGDTGVVYVIDGETGTTIGETFWSDSPEDVEALAPASGTGVWVGDIGDNRQSRPFIGATLVDVRAGDRAQTATTYRFVYPDGPADAESLLVQPRTGRLYIATKGVLGGQLYAAPQSLDPADINELEPVAEVGNLLTDGAFFPDGKHLVLRGYGRAEVYTFPAMEALGSIDLPAQPQGEGIAVSAAGEIFISSEGENQPILRVTMPEDLAERIGGGAGPVEPTGPPTSPRGAGSSESSTSPEDGSRLPWLAGGGILVAFGVAGAVMRSRRRHREA